MPTRVGIDVSHYQNEAGGGGANAVRWPQVKADGAKFCFVKISEKTSPDDFAQSNLRKARQAGMLVGGYHFIRNTATGTAQADTFLDNVELRAGDLLPALDVEVVPSSAAAKAALVSKCEDWVDAVRAKTGGKYPFLYTRANIWSALGNPSGFTTCPLWLARYANKPPVIPPGWANYIVWQFTDKGSISGIQGNVDENALNISFNDLNTNYTI